MSHDWLTFSLFILVSFGNKNVAINNIFISKRITLFDGLSKLFYCYFCPTTIESYFFSFKKQLITCILPMI